MMLFVLCGMSCSVSDSTIRGEPADEILLCIKE
jgi:hypothetical protein